MWIVEGADVELDCSCGHQIPKHEGMLWIANFTANQAGFLYPQKKLPKIGGIFSFMVNFFTRNFFTPKFF